MKRKGDSLQALLAELGEPDTPVRATLIYRLSDPTPEDMASFKAALATIPTDRRRVLFSRLAEASEISFELDFTDVALFALEDEDAEVRRSAIETLWFQQDPHIMRRFIALFENDESEEVRAAAASSLGRFVLAGEFEEIDQACAQETEKVLLAACHASDTPFEVHRRALESIAFSSRKEVIPLIEQAAKQDNVKMQASALFAMGRNSDPRWASQLIDALNSPEPELLFEATRAVGELILIEAVPRLIELAHQSDREIKEMAIWSLGEIGGEEAQRSLFELVRHEYDEGLIEAIEDAINMAMLSTGEFATYVFSAEADGFGPDDIDDLYLLDSEDLEEED